MKRLLILLLATINIFCGNKVKMPEEVKVDSLDKLAEHCYIFKNDKKAEESLSEEIKIALSSNNSTLKLKALFSNAILNINYWTPATTFDKVTEFLNTGIDYAEELGDPNYIAMAHLRRATIYRLREKNDEALKEILLTSSATYSLTDSIKAAISIEQGEILIAKGDANNAFNCFSNALTICRAGNNVALHSRVYHCFFNLYYSLNDSTSARSQIAKSMEINQRHKNKEGLCRDNIALGQLTDDTSFIHVAAALADEINSEYLKLYAKRIMFSWYMVKGNDSKQTLRYLSDNKDLNEYHKNQGEVHYNWIKGNVYQFSGDDCEAMRYYQIVDSLIQPNDSYMKVSVALSLASLYCKTGEFSNAAKLYTKAYDVKKAENAITELAGICNDLSTVYASAGNYQRAFKMAKEAKEFEAQVAAYTAKDKLTAGKLKNEELDNEAERAETENIQYMLITFMLAIIFLSLLLTGTYQVNEYTLKIFGFLAFISLFEFFVVLIDKYLHHQTDGKPLYIWLFKIGIIALMVPCQHFLEKKMVQYLASRRLINLRQRMWHFILSFKRKPRPVLKQGGENQLND